MHFLKVITSFFICLFLVSCKDTEKIKSSSLKPEITFVGKVSPLNKEKAEEIWQFIFELLDKLDDECKAEDLEKVKKLASQLDKMQTYADKSYEEHSFSFQNAKIEEGSQKISLDVLLLDIHSILGGSQNYISYKKIKQSKKLKTACDNLSSGFALNYQSYYNLEDEVDLFEHMNSWAQKVHKSILCVCP